MRTHQPLVRHDVDRRIAMSIIGELGVILLLNRSMTLIKMATVEILTNKKGSSIGIRTEKYIIQYT